MKLLKRFYIFASVLLLGWIAIIFISYTNERIKRESELTNLVKLAGNPFENNTLFFRHFEYGDYFGGHFYYPGAPMLEYESFVYNGAKRR